LRPVFFGTNFNFADDVTKIHYAQDRGHAVGNLNIAIRLDETRLPENAAPYELRIGGSNVTPALLPSDIREKYNDTNEQFLSGLAGGSTHELMGRTLLLQDVYATTTDFSSITQKRLSLLITDGASKPCHRARVGFVNLFWTAASINTAPSSIDFNSIVDSYGSHYALKTDHVPVGVMFVPKSAGVVTLEGTYVALRPLMNRTLYKKDRSSKIDYATPQLPYEHYSILEIGTLQNTAFTARSRVIVRTNFLTDVDCGLARDVLGALTGTTFCCTFRSEGYAQAIEFPFVPSTKNHCLAGDLSPNLPSVLTFMQNGQSRWLEVLTATGKRGFNSGQCPAFQKVSLDHGRLVDVSFWAGAPQSRNWPIEQLNQSTLDQQRTNLAPQWTTWEHSQFPYTLHKTGALTIDGSVVPAEDLLGQRQLNTPIYDFYDYETAFLKGIEHYPSRTVQAKAARVQGTAAGSHFEDSAMTLGKPRVDGKMVFGGKTINAVNLSFAPYARPSSINNNQYLVQTGIATTSPPAPAPENATDVYTFVAGVPSSFSGNTFARPSFGNRHDVWWKHGQTVNLPSGASVLSSPKVIENGEWCDIFLIPIDTKTTESIPSYTEVTAQKEKDAYLHTACLAPTQILVNPMTAAPRLHTPQDGFLPFRSPNFSLSEGSIDLWRFGRSGGGPWAGFTQFTTGLNQDINGPLPAPLTGSYALSSFSIGGVPCAGNIFRYSGVGDWIAEGTLTYNIYPKVTSINDSFQFVSTINNSPFYVASSNRTARYATVPVTEQWKMRADYVELYCELGSTLQQHGEYQPDPAVEINNEQSQRNAVRQTFMKHDQPRGRIAETVVYVAGGEPSPVLTLALRYRTALRAELKVSVDTSDLPDYPHSITNSESSIIANTVAGNKGIGNLSGEFQSTEAHHEYTTFAFTFNKEQTAQLMNGEEVLAMQWQKETNPQRPAFVDTGGIFLHAVKVQLDVSPAA
jgi:hypothetical protein